MSNKSINEIIGLSIAGIILGLIIISLIYYPIKLNMLTLEQADRTIAFTHELIDKNNDTFAYSERDKYEKERMKDKLYSDLQDYDYIRGELIENLFFLFSILAISISIIIIGAIYITLSVISIYGESLISRMKNNLKLIPRQNKVTYVPPPVNKFSHEEVKQIVYQLIKAEPETNLFIEDLSNILGFSKKDIQKAVKGLVDEGYIQLGEKGYYSIRSE
ncbi:MAG: hypothetical protein WDA59_10505 [Methanofastidiosum sp.]